VAQDVVSMESLFDSFPDALLLCDDSGAVLAVNELLLTLTGHTPTDLLGEDIELLFPEGLGHVVEPLDESAGPSRPLAVEVESRLLTADGDRIAVMVAIGDQGSDSEPTIIRIRPGPEWLDRTPSETQGWFRELMEWGALYVIGLDTDGVINYVNPTLGELAGVEEVVGLDWFEDFVFPDENVWLRDVFDSVLAGESTGSYVEHGVRVRGGRPRQIRWFNMRMVDTEGEVQGTLSVGTDVTDRQRLERRLVASANVAGALLDESETAAVLELVAVGARDLAWSEVAVVLTPGAGSGMVVEAVAGLDAETLVGQELPGGPWETLIDAGPQVPSGELAAHMRSLLPWESGPLIVLGLWGRHAHGVLLVANPPEQFAFGPEDRAALDGYAKDAALSIEHAQANRRLHHLALVEDRERIARDLHDIVIQDLFSAGMSIDVAMQLVGENEEVESRLSEAVETLNRTIDELRGSIFSLRDDTEEDLRTRVMRLIAEATSALGLTPVVRVENATKPLDEGVANHLLATLREALSNVARHSEANEVEIHVLAGPEVKLIVDDNGKGLPAEVPEGRGLENMAARARELGGEMIITEPADGGLRIEWTVPAYETAG
jgi:PAS domain S-box-containing protein